jgi:hypothetical protein
MFVFRIQQAWKHLAVVLDHSRFAQPLAQEGNCGGIWNAVHHTEPDKLL